MDALTKAFKWHERTTENWVNKFGLSQYQSLCFEWFKGIFIYIFYNVIYNSILQFTIF